MKHNIQLDCFFHCRFVFLKSRLLNTAHGCSGSAESCISSNRILIVKHSAAVALPCKALEIVIEIFLMRTFFNTFLLKCGIVQSPANIIVAAQIIQEYVILRQTIYNIKLFFQKTHVPGGNGMPCSSHCSYIVKHMAFRFFHSSKVRHNLFRLHNHFSKKNHSRAYNLADQAHHTHNGVYLRKIPAWCVQFFPDIGNRINSDYINSLVCKEKEIIHHLIENPRISIVQIPLIGVKGGHYIMPDFRQPGEITRCSSWKYLRYCFLIEGRNIRIVVEEITAHIFPVALAGFFCPFMILRGMIHYKIHTYTDAFFMAGICKFFQIIHSSQIFLYFTKISHCITAIRTAFRRIQKRHQMNVIYIVFFQIVKLAFHTFHVSCKIVYVKHHAKHVIFLVPARICFTLSIQCLQCAASFFIEAVQLIA